MKSKLTLPLAVLAALILIVVSVPWLGLPDPVKMNVMARFSAPSATNLLGTDAYGRDVLVRLVLGARLSLYVAFSAAAIAALIGVTMGVFGAYFRGVTEFLALRTTDLLLCFPPLLLALLVVTLVGPGVATLINVMAIVYAPGFARVAYAGAIGARSQDYVTAVRVLGARDLSIIGKTILPNIAGPLLVQFSLTVAAAITLESGLSFLGLGVVPPAPSWGLMIGDARATMMQMPQLLMWPCLALTGTVLLINWLCDALRDTVDPQPVVRRGKGLLEFLAPGLMPRPGATLEIRDLSVAIGTDDDLVQTVRNVSLSVEKGETVAVVGESGSGKSLTSLATVGLLPSAARPSSGAVWLNGEELLRATPQRLARLRGARVAMIFQDPMSSLNPVYRVGDQIVEALSAHGVPRAELRRRSVGLLRDVGIPDPEARARAFPHQMSGGMRQRVMIAMALANEPDLLIADEPTTALDVTVQAQILRLLKDLQERKGMAVLFITHSLPVVREIADRIVVLYAGEVVEEGPADEIFERPRHPYTAALLASAPGEDGDIPPRGIEGSVPAASDLPPGCVFAARCPHSLDACLDEHPALATAGPGHLSRCLRWSAL